MKKQNKKIIHWLTFYDENLYIFILGFITSFTISKIDMIFQMIVQNNINNFLFALTKVIIWLINNYVFLRFVLIFIELKKKLKIDHINNEQIKVNTFNEKILHYNNEINSASKYLIYFIICSILIILVSLVNFIYINL